MFKGLITENGLASLFRGLGPTLIRGFYANAIIFYTEQMCQEMFNKAMNLHDPTIME